MNPYLPAILVFTRAYMDSDLPPKDSCGDYIKSLAGAAAMDIAPQNLFVWNPHWQCFAGAPDFRCSDTAAERMSRPGVHVLHEVWNQNECAEHVIEALNMSKPQLRRFKARAIAQIPDQGNIGSFCVKHMTVEENMGCFLSGDGFS